MNGLVTVVGRTPTKRYFRVTILARKLKYEEAPFSIGIERSDRWLNYYLRTGMAIEITHDAWNHAGCQSSCIRRGGTTCRW